MNKYNLSNYSEVPEQVVRSGLSQQILNDQNHRYLSTGGRSQENRTQGFLPAFQDTRNGKVYLSRFSNGRVAPIHILDGLPEELITDRTVSGHVNKTLESVVAGFVCDGLFYSREQAAMAMNKLQTATEN